MTSKVGDVCAAAPDGPIIDVLIPVFNGSETIRSSVESILGQTEARIQVVIVNDGSTDSTANILSAMSAEDHRITVVDIPNGGIVEALNTGLQHCSAPFVARHDADDIAFPERLAEQLEFLLENPAYIAVGANAWHIDAAGNRLGSRTFFIGEPAPDPCASPSVEPYLMHPFLMVRREYLEKAGGYRHVVHSEDTDLYWRLLEHGQLFNLSDILGEFRIHAQSVSSISIVSGRIAAVHSQLAALSHRRRIRSAPDIIFERDGRTAGEKASSLQNIIDIFAGQLDAEELAYLQLSSAVKLLSLSCFRPYRLEDADLAYARDALTRHDALLSPADRAGSENYAARLGLKLLMRREWRQLGILRPGIVRMGAMAAQQGRRSLYLARNRLKFAGKRPIPACDSNA